MRIKYRFIVLAFFVLETLQGCASAISPQQSATPSPPPLTHLKVSVLGFLSFAPLYIARDEGYFTKQGLDVEFIAMNAGPEAVAAVSQGQLDVAPVGQSAALLNAIAREGKIKIVANRGTLSASGCAAYGLVARKSLLDSGALSNVLQLKGKTITVLKNSFQEYSLDRLLQSAGLTLQDVTVVDTPTGADIDALKNGKIDLASGAEPQISQIVQAGVGEMWMPLAKSTPDFDVGVVVYSPNMLKNQDVGRRFMVAYLQAIRQYSQGKTARNLEIIGKATNLDQQFLQKVCLSTYRADGRIDIKSVLDFQEWAIGRKLMDAPLREEQFWDPQFVNFANDHLQ